MQSPFRETVHLVKSGVSYTESITSSFPKRELQTWHHVLYARGGEAWPAGTGSWHLLTLLPPRLSH